MKIKIEGSGHTVEIECGDENRTVEQTAELAQRVWKGTKTTEQRLTMGYASQLTTQSHDMPVRGNGDRERKPDPVQA